MLCSACCNGPLSMAPLNPRPRGTFAKLYTIIGCAHRSRSTIKSPDDLIAAVEDAKSPAFTFIRSDARGKAQVLPCSRELIRERVNLCVELGILDPSGRLTKVGQGALRPSDAAKIVGEQVAAHLGAKSFDVGKNLKPWSESGTLALPTAKALFDRYSPSLPPHLFRILLNLLAECGTITAVQSRVYLS